MPTATKDSCVYQALPHQFSMISIQMDNNFLVAGRAVIQSTVLNGLDERLQRLAHTGYVN